jgi:hypothetical protein
MICVMIGANHTVFAREAVPFARVVKRIRKAAKQAEMCLIL